METASTISEPQVQKAYNRRVMSWAWYDWANHAYITTTASTFFPPYFIAIATTAFMAAGASPNEPAAVALIIDDQLLGLAFSFLAGRFLFKNLAEKLDTKRAVILGLLIYILIPVWGYFLKSQAEFFMIGWLVGTVQGGTQALSRAMYASLTPPAKSGELFGLYGLSEKFAGILGPLLYGVVGTLTHNPRASILSISVFFVLGIYTLTRVDVKKGAAIATAEEAQIKILKAAD